MVKLFIFNGLALVFDGKNPTIEKELASSFTLNTHGGQSLSDRLVIRTCRVISEELSSTK